MPRTDTHLWQPEMAVIECRHYAAYGWRAWTSSPSHWCYAGIGQGLPKNVPLPPPEYFCDNATHLAANKMELTKTQDTQLERRLRLNKKVQYNQSHLVCT